MLLRTLSREKERGGKSESPGLLFESGYLSIIFERRVAKYYTWIRMNLELLLASLKGQLLLINAYQLSIVYLFIDFRIFPTSQSRAFICQYIYLRQQRVLLIYIIKDLDKYTRCVSVLSVEDLRKINFRDARQRFFETRAANALNFS